MHGIVAVGLLFVVCVRAGNVSAFTVDYLAKAPLVAVCRVESVQVGGLLPLDKGFASWHSRHLTVRLQVLRALPELTAKRIYLNHYKSESGQIINGYPAYPHLEPGKSWVLPLAPDGDRWKLITRQGYGLVVPAVDKDPAPKRLASIREFRLHEIMNTLLHGSFADLFQFSIYMQNRYAAELNDEIVAGLVTGLPRGDGRWLDIATALLPVANHGNPLPSLEEPMASVPRRQGLLSYDAVPLLAIWTLREVPEGSRREGLLRNILRFSTILPWPMGVLAPEFKDDPVFLKLLATDLKQPQKGAVTIACSLVDRGQLALLDSTLEAGLSVLRDNGADTTDVNAACKLLFHRGSDAQFELYLTILKEARMKDAERYRQMWGVAWSTKSPRVLPILKLLLSDRRRSSDRSGARNCDIAGSFLQDFGAHWNLPGLAGEK